MEVEYKDLGPLGYPGYRVGDDGSVWTKRIRGHSKGERKDWKELKLIDSKGYRVVNLTYGVGKYRLVPVHRLVLASFIGSCPENMEGCHNDGNKSNNNLNNLRWDYHKANIYDCFPGSRNKKKEKEKREKDVKNLPDHLKSGLLAQEKLVREFGDVEVWKDIAGFVGIYQISNHGRIKSYRYGKYKILSNIPGPGERYKNKGLYNNGLSKEVGVHRLVLESFVGIPPIKNLFACHNDGNPKNNHLSNLRWDTPKSNSMDMVIHGTTVNGTRNWMTKVDDEVIKEIRKRYNGGLSTSDIGKQLNLKRSFVYKVAKKQTWAWLD